MSVIYYFHSVFINSGEMGRAQLVYKRICYLFSTPHIAYDTPYPKLPHVEW